MRILLDENMPRKLLAALAAEAHEVESVKSLKLAGIDNGMPELGGGRRQSRQPHPAWAGFRVSAELG